MLRWTLFVAIFLSLEPLAAGSSDAILRGEHLLQDKQFEAAETALREAVRLAPRSGRAHSDLAMALLSQKKSAEAVAEARKAVQLDPRNGTFFLQLGLALSAGSRPIDAAAAFRQAAALLPGQPFPILAIANAYAAAGDERALEAFEKALPLYPRDAGLRRIFAEYLWQSGRNARGDAVMEGAIRLAPDDAELHALYGNQLSIEGRNATAEAELLRAGELGNDSADVLVMLGNAQWSEGKADPAIEAFRRAVEKDPQNGLARLQLGRLLTWANRPDEAITVLGEAARMSPDVVALQMTLGRAYEATGDHARAESCFRNGVRLEPDLSQTHYALGRALLEQNKVDEGQNELAFYRAAYEKERVQQFARVSEKVKRNLAWVELNAGRAKSALAQFEKLSVNAPALVGKAAALSRLGRHQEAIEALEKARLIDSDDRTIVAQLSHEYELARRKP